MPQPMSTTVTNSSGHGIWLGYVSITNIYIINHIIILDKLIVMANSPLYGNYPNHIEEDGHD